jgi:peptide-methionine (S)-S-oxide reductase
MKYLFGFLIALTIFTSCNSGKSEQKAVLPKPSGKQQIAVFAGGCFWGIQEGFSQLKGVSKVTSGYAGGTKENPTYEEVSADRTGHAESIQIVYDPSVISFNQLLEAFFVIHDPTQLNRQGPDFGTSYRSIAFYSNETEKKQIEGAIIKYNSAKLHSEPVVTEVKPLEKFYPAEEYHQNYVRLHPDEGYVANVCGPKVQKLRDAFPNLLQDKYK